MIVPRSTIFLWNIYKSSGTKFGSSWEFLGIFKVDRVCRALYTISLSSKESTNTKQTMPDYETWKRVMSSVWTFLLGAFAKLQKEAISSVMSVCLSVCTRGTTRLPLNGFSWNLMWVFLKICLENSRFIKIWQELRVLHVRTSIHF